MRGSRLRVVLGGRRVAQSSCGLGAGSSSGVGHGFGRGRGLSMVGMTIQPQDVSDVREVFMK